MSSSETTDQEHRKLAMWLLAAHLVVGLVLGGITWWFQSSRHPEYPVFTLAGIVFAQASLVGIWGAFSGRPWIIRAIGVTVGIVYLGTMFGSCIDEH